MKLKHLVQAVACATLGWATQAGAQAGAGLQGSTPSQPTPPGAVRVPAAPQAAPGAAAPASGPTVTLRAVAFTGNSVFSAAELEAVLGSYRAKPLTLAGLNALAGTIEAHYRLAGHPFAQAYLPEQDLASGTLRITVLEARYGKTVASGEREHADGAQPFIDFHLKPGDLIASQRLERTLLILDDQPGMAVQPIVSPGGKPGEADLTVRAARINRVSGELGIDNTGARNTGEHRARALLNVNSPFRFGDRIALNALVTDKDMWLGSVDYDAPLGGSGLRGQIGYAHTNYQLGGQFARLDVVGYAQITSARLSYPLVRSQATNVTLSLGAQHKDLEDEYRAVNLRRNKSSDSGSVTLQFDRRDTLIGGGVTYGALAATGGRLWLDAGMRPADAATAGTQGSFTKLTLDVARIQKLVGDFSAYGRFSGQWTSQNLDSSEKFNLGGYYGVRAFPLGEGTGDQGWFGQLELRYALPNATPFVFHDLGRAKANAQPWDAAAEGTRRIAGTGVGVRTLHGAFSVDATLAWRTEGGASTGEGTRRNPRLFVMAGWRF